MYVTKKESLLLGEKRGTLKKGGISGGLVIKEEKMKQLKIMRCYNLHIVKNPKSDQKRTVFIKGTILLYL